MLAYCAGKRSTTGLPRASTVGAAGSIPDLGTKMPHAAEKKRPNVQSWKKIAAEKTISHYLEC